MEDMSGFCYDLLVKVISLSLQPEDNKQWNGDISYVESILKEDYIEFCDNAQKQVTLTGFFDNESIEENIVYRNGDCYLWYYFSYTYYLAGGNEIIRRKILWISLLLPYLYRMNQFGMATVEELDKLLIEYPIAKDTLETLKNSVGEFCAVMRGVEGINDLMPSLSSMDVVIDEAKAGLRVAIAMHRR